MSYRRSDDQIYLDTPATGSKSEELEATYMDNWTFVVNKVDTANSTVVTWEIEGSVDGTVWTALQNTQQVCNNANPTTSVSLEWQSFKKLRVSFLTVTADGDTYKVHFAARGV